MVLSCSEKTVGRTMRGYRCVFIPRESAAFQLIVPVPNWEEEENVRGGAPYVGLYKLARPDPTGVAFQSTMKVVQS